MHFIRAFLVWLVIVFAESAHAALRQMLLAPLVGDFAARRIAFFAGMLLIFLIACLFARWIAAPTVKAHLIVGAMWAALTIAFEFALGRFVLGYTRERMLEDYDLARGGLMGIGILLMVFAPLLAAKTREKTTGPAKSF